MFLTQVLAGKQMSEEQRKAFVHADAAFDPYKPYERKEMSLDEMLNMQYLTFASYQEIVQFMPLGLKEYLQFADYQNQTVIQISRCLVSAAACGEELNSYYEAERLMNAMLDEMSYHARRVFDQGCVQTYGLKFFQSSNMLLTEILTTIRRLKATRKKFRDGAFKVTYHETKPGAGSKSADSKPAAPAKAVDSAYHADTAFSAERSTPVKPAVEKQPAEQPTENQPQEDPEPAFQPDPALTDEKEVTDAEPLSVASAEFPEIFGKCGFQPYDEPDPDDFAPEPFVEIMLPSRASP